MPKEPATWIDVAGRAFDDAKRLFKEGDNAGALERHEWFHEHALEFKSGYYGVRLSYALSHWRQLADAYPPAMSSLIAIRDRDTQRLLAGTGSPQLLHDVDSINEALEQTDATLELFRQLEAAHPALARESFGFIDRLCLRSDPSVFRRHCTAPVAFFRRQRDCYLGSAVFLREQDRADSDALMKSREDIRLLAASLAEVFSDETEIVSKVTRLEATTDDELARRLE